MGRIEAEPIKHASLLIYPCLNPWGLENNSRIDAKGIDLNRIWDCAQNPLVHKIKKKLLKLIFLSFLICMKILMGRESIFMSRVEMVDQMDGRKRLSGLPKSGFSQTRAND